MPTGFESVPDPTDPTASRLRFARIGVESDDPATRTRAVFEWGQVAFQAPIPRRARRMARDAYPRLAEALPKGVPAGPLFEQQGRRR